MPALQFAPRIDLDQASVEWCIRFSNPQATFDAIVARVAPHEPVLLCWEMPPWHFPRHWCHRTTVADWFKQTLGVEVLELDIPAAAAIKLDRGMVPFWAAGSAPEKL